MVPKVCFIPSDPQAIRDLTYFCKEFQTIRCDRRPSELLSALFEYRVTSINCTKNRKMFSTSLKKYHLRKLQLFLLSDLAYKNENFFEFNHLKTKKCCARYRNECEVDVPRASSFAIIVVLSSQITYKVALLELNYDKNKFRYVQ